MSHGIARGLLWLGFLLVMLGEGRYRGVIAAWQVWLVLGSAIAVAVATVASAASRGQTCGHEGHDHLIEGDQTWRGTLLHAVPLCAALILGPKPGLGEQALSRSSLWMPTGQSAAMEIPDFQPMFRSTPATARDPLPPGTVADISVPMRLDLHRLYQPGAFFGVERVVVIGKMRIGIDTELITPQRLPSGAAIDQVHGSLYRFIMICCAADARAAQVVILGEPPPAVLTPETWVEVRGRWLRPTAGGLAGVVVDRWQVVPAPDVEFLLPY